MTANIWQLLNSMGTDGGGVHPSKANQQIATNVKDYMRHCVENEFHD